MLMLVYLRKNNVNAGLEHALAASLIFIQLTILEAFFFFFRYQNFY